MLTQNIISRRDKTIQKSELCEPCCIYSIGEQLTLYLILLLREGSAFMLWILAMMERSTNFPDCTFI